MADTPAQPDSALRRRLKRIGWLVRFVRFTRDLPRRLRALACLATRRRTIRQYLSATDTPRLHLGCGPNVLVGWLNLDADPPAGAVYADLRAPLPLPANTVAFVAAEHVIEHLDAPAAIALLSEVFRVLRPGGWVRLSTPDKATLDTLRTGPLDAAQQAYVDWITEWCFPERPTVTPGEVADHVAGAWGHQVLYDEATLRKSLSDVGFVDIRTAAYGQSDEPTFANIDGHGCITGRPDLAAFEALVLEARKPQGRANRH